MPRYYFHTEDGRCYPDEEGAELPDMEAVKEAALKTMAEMSKAMSTDFWEKKSLRIRVAEADGMTLMHLDLLATFSPYLRSARD